MSPDSVIYGIPGRNVVVDTNVLVSSLWSKDGVPAQVMSLVLQGVVVPCFDFRILEEYNAVLSRPKFKFETWMVAAFLDRIKDVGVSVLPTPCPNVNFIDEDDKKFYEVAVSTQATLITGNTKHFPVEPFIVTPSVFLSNWK